MGGTLPVTEGASRPPPRDGVASCSNASSGASSGPLGREESLEAGVPVQRTPVTPTTVSSSRMTSKQHLRSSVRLGSRPMLGSFRGYGVRAIGLVLAAMLLVCCQRSGQSPGLGASAKSRLSVHVASSEGSDDLSIEKVGPDGQSFFHATKPIITEKDIVSASLSTAADGRPAVVLDTSERGAARLREESESYVGRYLAFVWDGQVVYCPRVQTALGAKLMIVGGTDVLTSDALGEIADRINAAGSEGKGGA